MFYTLTSPDPISIAQGKLDCYRAFPANVQRPARVLVIIFFQSPFRNFFIFYLSTQVLPLFFRQVRTSLFAAVCSNSKKKFHFNFNSLKHLDKVNLMTSWLYEVIILLKSDFDSNRKQTFIHLTTNHRPQMTSTIQYQSTEEMKGCSTYTLNAITFYFISSHLTLYYTIIMPVTSSLNAIIITSHQSISALP